MNLQAEEALKIRNEILSNVPISKRKKVRYIRTTVKVVDKNGTVSVENCKRPCSKCPIRFRCYTEKEVTITLSEWKKIDLTKGTGKTIKEWKDSILNEISWVDTKPYSHNIISLSLGAISKGWGKNKANKIVEDFGLEQMGWHKE